MKQFDEKFSRKAKAAFENYNADHLAEAGWNSYTKKYGKKRNRALIIPLWARVASVAAILIFAVLLTNRVSHRRADEPGNQLAQENRNEPAGPEINKKDTTSANPELTATKPLIPSADPVIASAAPVAEAPAGKSQSSSSSGQHAVASDLKTGQVLISAPGNPRDEISVPAVSLLVETDKAALPLSEEAATSMSSHLSEAGKAVRMHAAVNISDNPIEIRLTGDAGTGLKLKPKEVKKVYSDIPREKMTTTIMTGLSGMMASIDNATSTSQGVSIGFYVESQLTRRISVRPGLAMAKHNYAMESMSGGNMALDYSAPELNGMSGTTTSYEADIEVVSMEVPVNFVFSIRKRPRSNLFVATGASTVFYLSQHMSGSFDNTYTRTTVDSYGKVSYESMTTSVEIDSEQELFNRVDFMGLANFSAGYSFPFGKTSHLLFEPFVQLPVKDLTSMNLRIRYGGLSMKIQF